MRDVSIVVVTYNSIDFIEECIKSIVTQTYKEFEIFIVDNNSQDNTVGFIRRYYPQVNLIENEENYGLSYAYNQGIKLANGEYILILNSDIVLERSFLHEIKKLIAKSGEAVGMFSPKILVMKNKDIIDSTGLLLSKTRRFFNRGNGEIDRNQYNQDQNIFGPCAAAALYNKKMLDAIKINGEYFDPDFFLLLEDFDIAWRARNLGWKAEYVPNAVCYHEGGISKKDNEYVQYLSFRNRYFLIVKNESLGSFVMSIPFYIIYDIPRFFYFLIKNRHAARGLKEIVSNLPKILLKRRCISKLISN